MSGVTNPRAWVEEGRITKGLVSGINAVGVDSVGSMLALSVVWLMFLAEVFIELEKRVLLCSGRWNDGIVGRVKESRHTKGDDSSSAIDGVTCIPTLVILLLFGDLEEASEAKAVLACWGRGCACWVEEDSVMVCTEWLVDWIKAQWTPSLWMVGAPAGHWQVVVQVGIALRVEAVLGCGGRGCSWWIEESELSVNSEWDDDWSKAWWWALLGVTGAAPVDWSVVVAEVWSSLTKLV
jgi:hypothetical protein